ncbi:hypothetical protein BGW38_002238, partial [Lunasporangiospora selenospora]
LANTSAGRGPGGGIRQSEIPQLSYTFSDDSDSDSNDGDHYALSRPHQNQTAPPTSWPSKKPASAGNDHEDEYTDEAEGAHDSEEERRDYDHDSEKDNDNNSNDSDNDNIMNGDDDDDDDDDANGPLGKRAQFSATARGVNGIQLDAKNKNRSAIDPNQTQSQSDSTNPHPRRQQDAHPTRSSGDSEKVTATVPSRGKDSLRNRIKDIKGKAKAKIKDMDMDKDKERGKERSEEDEDTDEDKPTLPRWNSRERKKRTKSMRDEGELNRFQRMLGHHYRDQKPRHQGTLDNPDLGWESDGSRPQMSRQYTSGGITLGHDHHGEFHDEHTRHHRPVLVSSPMSSEIDVSGAGLNGGHHPVFVNSPVSSVLDVSGSGSEQLERPEATPIQNISGNQPSSPGSGSAGASSSYGDRLAPGVWKSPSTSSLGSSTGSPARKTLQRGSTWMTAREYAPSIGHGSLSQQAIIEEEEEEDEEDRYTLAKAITRDSEINQASKVAGSSTENRKRSSMDSVVEHLVVEGSSTKAPKGPLKTTLTKAGTRFGRALLKRSPTEMKHSAKSSKKDTEPSAVLESSSAAAGPSGTGTRSPPQESTCTLERECRGSLELHRDQVPKEKKHVRFLTKVQTQLSSSRQGTFFNSEQTPVVKQDRVLVRKEMTERPGPHVFNSQMARRLERQSQGWREWWCVMKGPPSPTDSQQPVTKIRRKSKDPTRVEKGRLVFYYNHKKIGGVIQLTSHTTVSMYSTLDYSIAVRQNHREEIGVTVYIIRPRTISLACSWYMEIYTLLNGRAPIPSYLDLAVPDFDVKIRVPIPDGSDSEAESDTQTVDGCDRKVGDSGTGVENSLAMASEANGASGRDVQGEGALGASQQSIELFESFKSARSSLPKRMASKSFYMCNDEAKPTLVAPDEVTPKLLRSHALSLLKDVPDWTEVVKMWQDPCQHGDVALCWKRYDRIEWIYWPDRVLAETDSQHLRKEHIGFADGSDWSGRMDMTVVGPQVLEKTHSLELRPITHYPTKVKTQSGVELHEPDPVEGYLVRVSTFSGKPIRRFRRLYLTSHDHILIYTIPSQSHSPTMSHAVNSSAEIDPKALMFCISPHRSANPDHRDMGHSRSVRRLKAQVRSARGFIDMTKIESVRVLTRAEWDLARFLSPEELKKQKAQKKKEREENAKKGRQERLSRLASEIAEVTAERQQSQQPHESLPQQQQQQQQQEGSGIIAGEPDSYFYPVVPLDPAEQQQQQEIRLIQQEEQRHQFELEQLHSTELHPSEPLHNTLGRRTDGEHQAEQRAKTTALGSGGVSGIKSGLIRSATMVADLLLHNDTGSMDTGTRTSQRHRGGNGNEAEADAEEEEDEGMKDSNVFEIQMSDGGPPVRFRAYNAEAAHLWRFQLEQLAEYWRARKHQDVREHMKVASANYQLASSMDDDETGGRGGSGLVGAAGAKEPILDWDNERAMVSPQIWNWCVVNGCRSITKSGMLYYKPRLHSTFRKMFVVLTEGYLLLFHPHRRSRGTGQLIGTSACKLFAIHAMSDIYVYSGHFADEDTSHGTNDESERLARFFPDGLIADDPDEDCTFSIWRSKRRRMFSRRGIAFYATAHRAKAKGGQGGGGGLFGGSGELLSSVVKKGVVYGSTSQSCGVYRARSRADLEEWVNALNTEIERFVRAERRRVRGHYSTQMMSPSALSPLSAKVQAPSRIG